jgi:hypothetical protein
MPTILRNNDNSIEVDINFNLKYTVSKGGFDVIYLDKGDGIPYVYLIIRSNGLIDNTIKLDWRDTTSPDATFDSATDLRDTLLEWNIPKMSVNDSALPSGAATAAVGDRLATYVAIDGADKYTVVLLLCHLSTISQELIVQI